jgi:hypothetical protein
MIRFIIDCLAIIGASFLLSVGIAFSLKLFYHLRNKYDQL